MMDSFHKYLIYLYIIFSYKNNVQILPSKKLIYWHIYAVYYMRL